MRVKNENISDQSTPAFMIRNSNPFLLIFLITVIYRGLILVSTYPADGWATLNFGHEMGAIAWNLAEGRGYSSPFGLGTSPTAWYPPFVPLVWSAIFKIFGVFSPASLTLLYLLQLAARGMAAVLYLVMTRILLAGAGKHSSFLAALAPCLWPDHTIVSMGVWYTPWLELALAALVSALLILPRTQSLSSLFVLGASAAFLALINPVPLTLLPVALVWLIVRGSMTVRYACKSLGLVLFCISVALAPWVWRNYLVFGHMIPLRSNFGVELRQGNNPIATIVQSETSIHPALNLYEREKYNSLGEYEYNREALHEAIGYIAHEPRRFLARTVFRAFFFWVSDLFHPALYADDAPWWQQGAASVFGHCFRFMHVIGPIVVVFILTILGEWKRVDASGLIFLLLLTVPLPYYVTHIHPSYFALVKPYLIMLAACGSCAWLSARATRRSRR